MQISVFNLSNSWQKRKIKSKLLEKIKSDLSAVNCHDMLQQVTTKRGFELFQSNLNYILESHAPMKKTVLKSKKIHQPWIMGCIQNSIRKQKLLYKKSLISTNVTNRVHYKDYRTCQNKIKHVSKVSYY